MQARRHRTRAARRMPPPNRRLFRGLFPATGVHDTIRGVASDHDSYPYRYVAKEAKPEEGVWFRSPAGSVFVPVVERLPIVPQVQRGDDWYTVNVAWPWITRKLPAVVNEIANA